MPEYGPFDTEDQALATEAAATIRAPFTRNPLAGYGTSVPEALKVLTDECAAAGVELGAHDLSELQDIAWREPAGVVSVAGIIRRAWEAGRRSVNPPAEPGQAGEDEDRG
jgi:hypothetical protein